MVLVCRKWHSNVHHALLGPSVDEVGWVSMLMNLPSFYIQFLLTLLLAHVCCIPYFQIHQRHLHRFPTYHFACVVDDHLMKITHVIRCFRLCVSAWHSPHLVTSNVYILTSHALVLATLPALLCMVRRWTPMHETFSTRGEEWLSSVPKHIALYEVWFSSLIMLAREKCLASLALLS